MNGFREINFGGETLWRWKTLVVQTLDVNNLGGGSGFGGYYSQTLLRNILLRGTLAVESSGGGKSWWWETLAVNFGGDNFGSGPESGG